MRIGLWVILFLPAGYNRGMKKFIIILIVVIGLIIYFANTLSFGNSWI